MSFLFPPNVQQLKEKRDVSSLVKALSYPFKSQIRIEAVEALGNLRDPLAIRPLVETLKDDQEKVAQAAAKALVEFGELAVESLIALVEQKKWDGTGWNLRSQALRLACETLGQLGDPRAISTLMMATKDANTTVSVAAERALKQIQKE